jgi:CRISPR-associated protein Cmr5
MSQTLDQQRASLAWQYASAGMQQHGKEYKGLAKGAPALIMNSGLMPTLAFYKGKGSDKAGNLDAEKPAAILLQHLLAGLSERLKPTPQPKDFTSFMAHLQGLPSPIYLRFTDEALELLKWIRQFVDAVEVKGA